MVPEESVPASSEKVTKSSSKSSKGSARLAPKELLTTKEFGDGEGKNQIWVKKPYHDDDDLLLSQAQDRWARHLREIAKKQGLTLVEFEKKLGYETHRGLGRKLNGQDAIVAKDIVRTANSLGASVLYSLIENATEDQLIIAEPEPVYKSEKDPVEVALYSALIDASARLNEANELAQKVTKRLNNSTTTEVEALAETLKHLSQVVASLTRAFSKISQADGKPGTPSA